VILSRLFPRVAPPIQFRFESPHKHRSDSRSQCDVRLWHQCGVRLWHQCDARLWHRLAEPRPGRLLPWPNPTLPLESQSLFPIDNTRPIPSATLLPFTQPVRPTTHYQTACCGNGRAAIVRATFVLQALRQEPSPSDRIHHGRRHGHYRLDRTRPYS
jgi:hypothetical protein